MYAAIEAKFAEAVAQKALVFTPSTEVRKRAAHGVEVVYTYAPALAQKPTKSDNDRSAASGGATGGEKPASPWLPADERLVVERLADHTVVLNKFALAKYHFLLVTNKFESQDLPLSEEDWAAAMNVLRAANRESGKRHVGFFNCGPLSGASIAHKHIQFMTLPENFAPFTDSAPSPEALQMSVTDSRVPFLQYITKLPPNASVDDVLIHYSELLGRVLTKVSLANPEAVRPQVNYNLVFTEEWIMATPRSAETTKDGVSINALGTIGLVLAKTEDQLRVLEQQNFDMLTEVGFPYEELRIHAPDHTGYTHY